MAAGTIKYGYIENRFEQGMHKKLGKLTREDLHNVKPYGAGYAKVYICSPYAGNVSENVWAAKEFCKYAISQKKQPVASHLLYPQFLDDRKEREREMGLAFGLNLMEDCSEVWVFKEYGGISEGMSSEIEAAKRLRIPVVFIHDPEAYGKPPWDPIAEYDKAHAAEPGKENADGDNNT